jgi:hypothetical protein
MATSPRQPEQVDLDLTASPIPGEAIPGDSANPLIRRESFNLKIWVTKIFGIELGIEEGSLDPGLSAALQLLIIVAAATAPAALVWIISESALASTIIGLIVLIVAVVFVRTARRWR